jgi:tetratricopeptide (TPR) repeat protein
MKRHIAVGTALALLLIAFAACSKPIGKMSAAELLGHGEKYLLEMNYAQAAIHFDMLTEVEPRNPRGYTGLAEAYLGLDDVGGAVSALQDGLAELPDDRSFLAQLAESYEDIIAEAPDAQDAYIGLADARAALGDADRAADALRRGLARLPGSQRIAAMLAEVAAPTPALESGTEYSADSSTDGSGEMESDARSGAERSATRLGAARPLTIEEKLAGEWTTEMREAIAHKDYTTQYTHYPYIGERIIFTEDGAIDTVQGNRITHCTYGIEDDRLIIYTDMGSFGTHFDEYYFVLAEGADGSLRLTLNIVDAEPSEYSSYSSGVYTKKQGSLSEREASRNGVPQDNIEAALAQYRNAYPSAEIVSRDNRAGELKETITIRIDEDEEYVKTSGEIVVAFAFENGQWNKSEENSLTENWDLAGSYQGTMNVNDQSVAVTVVIDSIDDEGITVGAYTTPESSFSVSAGKRLWVGKDALSFPPDASRAAHLYTNGIRGSIYLAIEPDSIYLIKSYSFGNYDASSPRAGLTRTGRGT